MRKISKKAKLVVASSVALAALGGGVAYGYWSTTGTGSGTGSTSTGKVDVLSFTQNSLSPMFAGDTAQPLSVTVKNTSSENVYVANVKAYLTVAGGLGSCAADDYKLNGAAAPGSAIDAVPLTWAAADLAPNAEANATGTVQFNNKPSTNQDGCKGATITVHYLGS
jgi:hypothetical protein